jgi:phytoene dehydrogenase-like protein
VVNSRYDAIVIGAGHNGLACAAYLARAGKRVLVLEAASRVGGAAVTREFAPGYSVSACAHLLNQMPRTIVNELGLERHGLKFSAERMATIALAQDGDHLRLPAQGGGAIPASDASSYLNFMARMRRFAAHLRPMLDATPPRLGSGAWQDGAALLRLAWRVRSLGRADMRELLRIIGMNVYDLVTEHFEAPNLRAAVAFDAVLGTNFGPRTPGAVLTLLYRMATEHGALAAAMAQPLGGMGAVSNALAETARSAGADIRTGMRVARLQVRDDRAAGVFLTDGTIIEGRYIISNADPRTSFFRLLGAEHLDTGFERRVDHFRQRGLAAKVHLALSAPPAFRKLEPEGLRDRLIVAPSLDYIETAYNAVKYSEFSEAPAIEIVVPSACDPSLAPHGRHVLSAIVQYAPYAHKAGWDHVREAFLDRVIDTIEAYAPGLRQSIVGTELLTPADIETEFGISGGHWHHGELAFDQFFMVRPVPGAAQYETPVANFFLCGAGAHPGGGVMGVAGRNAALQVLKKAA